LNSSINVCSISALTVEDRAERDKENKQNIRLQTNEVIYIQVYIPIYI